MTLQTTPLDEDGQGTPYAVYGYGAQIAEVEVDIQLGTTRVLRVTAAHDLGRGDQSSSGRRSDRRGHRAGAGPRVDGGVHTGDVLTTCMTI